MDRMLTTIQTQSSRRWLVTGAAIIFSSLLFAPFAAAGEADVVGVDVSRTGDDLYRFSVTVLHEDAGWDHYANRWDVVGLDGNVYGERILAHPHDNEQPFTRSLSGVKIPAGVREVILRANDSVHGLGGKEMTVSLP